VTDRHPLLDHPLADLFRPRSASSRRASSWDRSGGNQDYIRIEPGATAVLMEHDGPGCITHVYCAMILPDLRDHRNAILRAYWDGSERPSVEVPLGDFFTLGHGRVRELSSYFVGVNPGFGSSHGLNAYFPMPYETRAVITIENRGATALGGPLGALWYHIEYETYDEPLPGGTHRFHASYRQERPTAAVGDVQNVTLHETPNVDGTENYVVLDTSGSGRMVGLLLEIENVQGTNWYGEGDDMVFIDGESWPPSIHGTGTEEIFGGGACPTDEYAGLYSGFHLIESPAYDGLVAMYRWYVRDPIHFSTSLRWTVEHGHANNFTNNYSSVAYWYQTPRAALPELPAASEMSPPLSDDYEEVRDLLWTTAVASFSSADGPSRFFDVCRRAAPFYRGDWAGARAAIVGA
jgi:hypothetical protein